MGLGLLPCIRQVDSFLQCHPQWVDRLVESHPECAFQALNGGRGVIFSKHTEEGIAERAAILSSYVTNVEELLANASSQIRNDLLDALCLAVVSSRGFASVQQEVFRDRLGFPMRIVIPVE
jgi:8-oxo-dGTP diphosphatase